MNTPTVNIGALYTTESNKVINIGSANISTGSQTINMNRPMTINYSPSVPSSFSQLGYIQNFTGIAITMPVVPAYRTLIQTSSLTAGVYMITYELSCTPTLIAPATGTPTIMGNTFGISTVPSANYSHGCYQYITESVDRPSGANYKIAHTCVESIPSSGTLYFLGVFLFSSNSSLAVTGSMTVVRIG